SVAYSYDRRILGFIPMSNPALWPLNEPIAVAAVDRASLAGTSTPLDALTLFFAYHKLSGEAVDFEEIALNLDEVRRAGPFDRDKVATEQAAQLRDFFEAVDPSATYVLALRTGMNYQINQERFDVETFGPDRFLRFSPFDPRGGGVRRELVFTDVQLANRYNRRLEFV